MPDRKRPFNVVITGSTKGIGLALAREHLKLGDNVLICSRTEEAVDATVKNLKGEFPSCKIFGTAVDVSDADSVEALAQFARTSFGEVMLWVNNAGATQPKKLPLKDVSPSTIQQVVNCNMLGTLLCTQAAIKLMQPQPAGGQIFIMDGAGSNGMATSGYATYGFTKAGISQLVKTLGVELKDKKGTKVGIHALSPGLVMTDLLLASNSDGDLKTFKIFNILAERPDTVAQFLVPRYRAIEKGSTGKYIKFLTGGGAFWRFLTFASRKNRLVTIHEKDGTVIDNESGEVLKQPFNGAAPETLSANNNSALLKYQ
jgi:chlorophyll(ide) b reductase